MITEETSVQTPIRFPLRGSARGDLPWNIPVSRSFPKKKEAEISGAFGTGRIKPAAHLKTA